MKDVLKDTQTTEILKILDDALDKGPWDQSNFLRVIGKNLQEIRDKFAEEVDKKSPSKQISSVKKSAVSIQGGKEVFIALYSADGAHLSSWERIIANLPNQIISRPIYANEEDAKFLIKSKENKLNEAYIAILIDEENVLKLSADKVPVDKFGKALMVLKGGALHLENVTRFTHVSGTYQYSKGHLVKNE